MRSPKKQEKSAHLIVLAQHGQGGVLPGRVVLCHVDGTVRRPLGRVFSTFLTKQGKKVRKESEAIQNYQVHTLKKMT